MTPEALAALQARAYRDSSPWQAEDFAGLLTHPTTRLFTTDHAFLLARFIADEAEILALATDPDHQREGLATGLLTRLHTAAAHDGITTCFLEVAAPNAPAHAAYTKAGYTVTGRRKGYYLQADGRHVDALVMSRAVSPAAS